MHDRGVAGAAVGQDALAQKAYNAFSQGEEGVLKNAADAGVALGAYSDAINATLQDYAHADAQSIFPSLDCAD